MKWYHQLRWKLFISHLLTIVIAVAVLVTTARFVTAPPAGDQPPMVLDSTLPIEGVAPPPQPSTTAGFWPIFEQALLLAAFAALAAAVVVTLFVSRRIVEPLQELSVVSHRLAHGFYRDRVLIDSNDELADLARSVNQLAEALEQTERRRLALIGDVAHELRTPLSTIRGYMEALREGMVQADTKTFGLIQREAARLERLTQELALLSRVEADQLPAVPRPTDLADVLDLLVARFEPQFLSSDVALCLDIPPTLPILWADPDRLEQVLINLVANALRYTPAGGRVTISATSFELYIQITVRDTGVGIAPEHLAHLFDRFYRVDRSRSRSSGGTGVGLTIARYFVYAHGGTIWAESDGLGCGSSFHLTWPTVAAMTPVS